MLLNLDVSDQDDDSGERSATQNAVRHAMNHPVDPRTYSRPGQERPHNINPHIPAAQLGQPHLVGPQWDEVSGYQNLDIFSD
jgi:hypothetical protein